MGLLAAFRRRSDTDVSAAPDAATLRTRARRRLIGATVLLGLAVIAFPLILETQPRPVALDIPIEIPRKDTATPLGQPIPNPSTPASGAAPRVERRSGGAVTGVAPSLPEVAPSAVAPTSAPSPSVAPSTSAIAPPAPTELPAPSSASPAAVGATAASAPVVRPIPVIVEKAGQQGRELPVPAAGGKPAQAASAPSPAAARPRSAGAESERAKALLEDRAASAPGGARFVVQVGSFTDAAAVRETRQKVERLGVKTYTQVAEIDGVRRTRVRVGPFGTRDEADRQAAALRAAGLAVSVLTFNP